MQKTRLLAVAITLTLVVCAAGAPTPTSESNSTERRTACFNATNAANATHTINATDSTSATNIDALVSGHNALWPLVSLGLTAMVQASHADKFLSGVGLSTARSSPIICAADLLITLVWLMYGLHRGLGLRGSMRRMRIDLDLFRDGEEARMSNGTPTYSLVFFGIAVMPQAIQLFAVQGVHWTQLWAALYFIAYLVSATSKFVGTRRAGKDHVLDDHDSEPDQKVRRRLRCLTRWIYGIAFLVQVWLWIWCLKQTAGLLADRRMVLTVSAAKGLFAASILSVALLAILAIVLVAVAKKSPKRRVTASFMAIVSGLLASGLLTTVRVMLPLPRFIHVVTSTNTEISRTRLRTPLIVVGILAVWILGVAIVVLLDWILRMAANWVKHGEVDAAAAAERAFYQCTGGNIPLPLDPDAMVAEELAAPKSTEDTSEEEVPPFTGSAASKPRPLRRFASIAFVTVNLAVAVMYYMLRFDPSGTARAPWVENLS